MAPRKKLQHLKLWQRYRRDRNIGDRNRLIELYMPLAKSVVWRYRQRVSAATDPDELLSYASEGLLQAVERFDPDRGWAFNTFATWRIRGAVLDGLRTADWLPRYARDGEQTCRQMISLDALVFENNPSLDKVDCLARSPAEPVDDFWKEVCRGMSKQERLVLLLYWAFDMNFPEVGKQLGVTESRCCQIHKQLLQRLRQSKALDDLR